MNPLSCASAHPQIQRDPPAYSDQLSCPVNVSVLVGTGTHAGAVPAGRFLHRPPRMVATCSTTVDQLSRYTRRDQGAFRLLRSRG